MILGRRHAIGVPDHYAVPKWVTYVLRVTKGLIASLAGNQYFVDRRTMGVPLKTTGPNSVHRFIP